MRPVAVIAAGKTRFGAFPERDLRSLAVEAGEKCLKNGHVSPSQVEAFYLGNFAGPSFTGQNHLAPYISTALGIRDVPATRFEAACASSGSAFFHAFSAVASGLYDCVMVAGVEKMTSQPTARVTEILAGAGDCAGEIKAGSTFPSLFAMIARRHMYEFGTTREQLAAVAVKNHANGALNPDAHMRKVITIEEALNARPVAEPLGVYDCSLISDGAAAVILAPVDRARDFTSKPVRVLGVAQASDFVALDQKPDITRWPASGRGISSSQSCTIVLPSQRLWRSKTSGLSSAVLEAHGRNRAPRRAPARNPSTLRAALNPRVTPWARPVW